jgi:hypothetical protein
MNRSALIILLLCFAAVCRAQDACVVTSIDAPALFGLHLNMSPAEAQIALGGSLKIKIKKNGERTFFQNFIEKPAARNLSGVRAIYLRFFDRKLYQFEIFYENRNDWQTLAAFTDYLSASFKLPAASWQIKKGRAEIKCTEVSLVADYVLNPRIEITDEVVRSRIEDARKNKQ